MEQLLMKFIFPFLFLSTLGCVNSSKNSPLNIAVSANMEYAMDSIIQIFEEEHNIKCTITSASSGLLTAQIEHGAPYDLFISANMAYPAYLHSKKMGETPKVYAQGGLVLVVNKNINHKKIDEVLADSTIERIGIADKRTAPYGLAATQFLERTNKYEKIKKRLIVTESISHVNQIISSKFVDAGFTSLSFRALKRSNYNYYIVEPSYFDPIEQGFMILNLGREKHSRECDLFLTFFSSPQAKSILNHFGYLVK